MRRALWRCLVPLAMLQAAAAVSSGGACGPRRWQCANKDCIEAFSKCDGNAECADRSDEVASVCNQVPQTELSTGHSTEVRLQYDAAFGHPVFYMCDDSSCGRLAIEGANANGELQYWNSTGCNLRSGFCPDNQHVVPDGSREWSTGEYSFVAERRSSQLAVWLQGRPNRVASVSVPAASRVLKVRPWQWSADMPVQFKHRAVCGPRKWQCANGNCIDAFSKCDGRAECADGSDEFADVCNAVPSTDLNVGHSTEVQIIYDKDFVQPVFYMCDSSSCGRLAIEGANADGQLQYWKSTGCNVRSGFCSDNTHVVPDGSREWSPGEYSFVAERRSSQLAVWLQGRPNRVASVSVPAASRVLKVRPWQWSADMPVQFKHLAKKDACGKAQPGPSELVQDGDTAAVETVPWHAAIYVESSGRKDKEYVCGGSLVARCFVATAAHCVPEDAKMFVALGKFFSGWDSEDEPKIVKTRVKTVHKHAYYRGHANKQGYDIAVLELETCADPSDKVFPICLDGGVKPTSKSNIKIAGWGNETTTLPELESVNLSQLDFEDCFNSMSSNSAQLAYVTHDKFCAKRRKDTPRSGLLQGDSGGGALVKRDGAWFLAGIVSIRLHDDKLEDVYALTDVSQYVHWIKRLAKL
ncbi:coagulation factor IX-like [Thrips palmi]|uniref:Coagulation factor IX-like n=1 Tax=Thrips palmi TaxID=161013 RepID=A0A6P8YSH9_THRPL|nr:coagulation factor IX-like [Thrips palmi]